MADIPQVNGGAHVTPIKVGGQKINGEEKGSHKFDSSDGVTRQEGYSFCKALRN